ncbi:MAG: histidine phosphatase family protein [Ruminococcaceae bacterium]|nr:histidine phosphatase family protein [Oscillospiraceae bacterium]
MKLYMIRHGQSEENLRKAYSGQMDSRLTEQGEKDALGVRKVLQGISFDKVYSSDLSRAVRTQEIALPGIISEKLPLVREISVGNLEGKKFEELGESFILNRSTYNFVPYGGENYEMLQERAKKFLEMMSKEDCDIVAVFSHGGFINVVLGCILGCRVTNENALSDNCGVSVFEYNDSRWALRKWNMTADDKLTEYNGEVI